jgi:hypothetical protein
MTTEFGYIVQVQEDHPHNAGWWRYSRPVWVANDAEIPERGRARWMEGCRRELMAEQAHWDAANPRG